MKHEKFVTGVPIWSQLVRYPQVWCKTCRLYHVDFWFYLKVWVKYELWNIWTNRFYYKIFAPVMEKVGLFKRECEHCLPRPIWKLK